jgi:hypothetical protein
VIALIVALLLACSTPAAAPSPDQRLADSEQQGQQQRPLNTPMPDTEQEQAR